MFACTFPVERIVRDLRLASIWTGTNQIMSAIVANEWYKEHARGRSPGQRDFAADALEAGAGG